MKGARFLITGAPITEIIWPTIPDDNQIGVMIEAENFKTKVDDNYLVRALNMLDNGFKVFVLGKLPNELK